MPTASYSKSELVEIIRTAFARQVEAFLRSWPGSSTGGKTPDDILAEGLMLDEVWTALRCFGHDAITAKDILRQALMPPSPFVTIPKLDRNFHLRMHQSGGVEIVTDDGILSDRDVVVRLGDNPGGRPPVLQELIDELDQEACATITAEGKRGKKEAEGNRLTKEARAALIQPALAAKGHNLAVGTIKNRLQAKRS